MPGDQRLVVTYRVGVDIADDGDTLVFDQGSTDANDDNLGSWSLTAQPFYGGGELDFAAVDSSEPIGETVPTTNDISPWTVTHDRGGS
jgi:hypothetical protein